MLMSNRPMLWATRGVGGVFIAMLLSLAFVVQPAHAIDEWEKYATQNKIPNASKYKYSYNYHTRTWGPASGFGAVQPVSPSVNPSAGLPGNTANTPLSGKIIEPGKTMVRLPSTYGPVAKFSTGVATALAPMGWGRLLGGIGVGMGGTSLPPANANQIALQQGVSQGCIDGGACTSSEISKKFLIGSCGQLSGAQSCSSIGAVGVTGETDAQKWFKNDALPLLEDIWAKITGQKSGTEAADVNGHYTIIPKGCNKMTGFEYTGGTGGKMHVGQEIVKGKPATSYESTQWTTDCTTASLSNMGTNVRVKTTCINAAGNTGDAGNADFGIDLGIGQAFSASNGGVNAVALCDSGPYVLASLMVRNLQTQAQHNAEANDYQTTKFMEWLNPDPAITTIEDTKITTSWKCETPDGVVYDFTKSVTKIDAVVAPSCAPGSRLKSHSIVADTAGGKSTTLDQGAENSTEMAKYADCNGGGCALQVHLDGAACTAGNQDCRTWPSIRQVTPSRVTCKWGSYTVATEQCNVLSNAYQTESGVVFDPRSGTWTAVDIYGQPQAPNPEPWNPVNPAPVVGAAPGTGSAPGTGTAAPTQGVNPAEVPGTSGENCLAHGWSWNPVSWVMVPVQCALQWAFVPPKPRIDAAIQTVIPKMEARGIEPFVMPFMTAFDGLGGAGCQGPAFDLSAIKIPQTYYFFSACDEPMSHIATGVNSFFALSIVIQGGMSIIRGVASAFGFNWNLGKGDDS